jgi:DNA-binding transcriptional regulator of glucitol operon
MAIVVRHMTTTGTRTHEGMKKMQILLVIVMCLACWVILLGWSSKDRFQVSRRRDNQLGAVVILGPPGTR